MADTVRFPSLAVARHASVVVVQLADLQRRLVGGPDGRGEQVAEPVGVRVLQTAVVEVRQRLPALGAAREAPLSLLAEMRDRVLDVRERGGVAGVENQPALQFLDSGTDGSSARPAG